MSSIHEIQSSLQTKNNTNKDEQFKKLNKKLDKVIVELDSLKNKIENPEYKIKAPEIAKEKDRYRKIFFFFPRKLHDDNAYLLFRKKYETLIEQRNELQKNIDLLKI